MRYIRYDSFEDLKKISQGLDFSLAELNRTREVYKVCIKAKHLRTKFKNERAKAKRPLQIIHTVVWPYKSKYLGR